MTSSSRHARISLHCLPTRVRPERGANPRPTRAATDRPRSMALDRLDRRRSRHRGFKIIDHIDHTKNDRSIEDVTRRSRVVTRPREDDDDEEEGRTREDAANDRGRVQTREIWDRGRARRETRRVCARARRFCVCVSNSRHFRHAREESNDRLTTDGRARAQG